VVGRGWTFPPVGRSCSSDCTPCVPFFRRCRGGLLRHSRACTSNCLPAYLGAVLLPDPLPTARGRTAVLRGVCRSHLSGRSLRLRRFVVPAFCPQPRKLLAGRFVSRLGATGCFRASPRMNRLATDLRRIRYALPRIAGSPLVAPHSASRRRNSLRLRSQRLAPARTCTTLKRPHGYTRSRDPRTASSGQKIVILSGGMRVERVDTAAYEPCI